MKLMSSSHAAMRYHTQPNTIHYSTWQLNQAIAWTRAWPSTLKYLLRIRQVAPSKHLPPVPLRPHTTHILVEFDSSIPDNTVSASKNHHSLVQLYSSCGYFTYCTPANILEMIYSSIIRSKVNSLIMIYAPSLYYSF